MTRVLIINTGGTISSVKTANGYEPQPGFVAKALQQMPQMTHADMPDYDLIEINPLIDSSNITVADWNQLARLIAQHYDSYHGFVIFHGTDTMAYTASALSFMLENLAKPVILTGSQIPMGQLRNDARDNVIGAVYLAAHTELNEVCVYFNDKLLRGNRSQKVSAYGFSAFDSPNYPHLATMGIAIQLNKELLLSKPDKAFAVSAIEPHYIANFRLFPGFSTQVLHQILQQDIKGLILESYGIGNAQNNDADFLATLSDASKRGVVIVNCSQCQQASVDMHSYATGQTLLKAGVVSGFDMTPEAAHCKLLYLLTKHHDTQHITTAVGKPLVGELSC